MPLVDREDFDVFVSGGNTSFEAFAGNVGVDFAEGAEIDACGEADGGVGCAVAVMMVSSRKVVDMLVSFRLVAKTI